MMHLRFHNVRARLTAWYVSVLAATLLICGIGTSALVLYEFRSELDHLAIDNLESLEGLLSFDANGRLTLKTDYHDHPYPASAQDSMLEVLGLDGKVLYRNELLGSHSLGGPPQPGEGIGEGYSMRTIRMPDGARVRVIAKRHFVDGIPTLERIGFNEKILWQRFWQIGIAMIAGLPLALILAGVGGYFLARHALSPIEEMSRRVHEINAERLNERLEVENPRDELGILARAFNETLARLQRSFDQLRQFAADASHELRTPLTAIRSVGEVALKNPDINEDSREVIGSMLEEAARLGKLVDNLLMISRAESGQIQIERKTIRLFPFVREGLSLIEALAEENAQTLSVEGEEKIEVEADSAILGQVLINLVDNAIKNSPSGAPIAVRIWTGENHNAIIEVKDSGPGIPPEHRDKVFDRFYRVDEGRSREAGGAGLGLAIAKWGAEAHGGRIELHCPPTGGCVFRVTLPMNTRTIGGKRRIEIEANAST